MAVVLGLNAYHADASAAVLVDGRVVAAAEEERFRRQKHCAGFPAQAATWCLADAGATLADLDAVALNRRPSRALARKALFALTHPRAPGRYLDRLRNRRAFLDTFEAVQALDPGTPMTARRVFVEHHMAHVLSAWAGAPYDAGAAVSLDGFGDFASTAIARARGETVEIHRRVAFPHSLGVLYQAVTQHLGFCEPGDEYKVMGLAAHGRAARAPGVGGLVRPTARGGFALDLGYFRHHRADVGYRWQQGPPAMGRLLAARADDLLGPPRAPDAPVTQAHADLAAALQSTYERLLAHVLAAAAARAAAPDLALAGGCALNAVANARIPESSPFRRVFVPPAAGDAGGAIGAGLAAHRELTGRLPRQRPDPYLGPEIAEADAAAALAAAAPWSAGCRVEPLAFDALVDLAARALDAGLVVGWARGRMELGARALGNRSILADPRRADVRELLNARIKRREAFRPFAPAVLRAHVGAWFEPDAGGTPPDVPWMTRVARVRADRRAAVPAAVHVDGTARLQTVAAADNPAFHALIARFHALTGVPLVLNTSFNVGAPIVRTAAEALDTFLATEMDLLCLGPYAVLRPAAARALYPPPAAAPELPANRSAK
jgi:carbamoyltransferase